MKNSPLKLVGLVALLAFCMNVYSQIPEPPETEPDPNEIAQDAITKLEELDMIINMIEMMNSQANDQAEYLEFLVDDTKNMYSLTAPYPQEIEDAETVLAEWDTSNFEIPQATHNHMDYLWNHCAVYGVWDPIFTSYDNMMPQFIDDVDDLGRILFLMQRSVNQLEGFYPM